MKKSVIALTLVLLFVVSFAGCSSSASLFSFYNETLNVKVSIGMEKAEVDKLLGEPMTEPDPDDPYPYDMYTYVDGILLTYRDDRLVDMYYSGSDGNAWSTTNGVKIGTPKEKVESLYGKPMSDEQLEKGYYVYLFDENGKRATDQVKSPYYISFEISTGKVDKIFIAKFS